MTARVRGGSDARNRRTGYRWGIAAKSPERKGVGGSNEGSSALHLRNDGADRVLRCAPFLSALCAALSQRRIAPRPNWLAGRCLFIVRILRSSFRGASSP